LATIPDVTDIALELATPADAPPIAAIVNRWIDATDWVPRVDSPGVVEAHLREEVLARQTCWVAVHGGPICGFLALDAEDCLVTSLYLSPAVRGGGVGKALLDQAKAECPQGLGLWTFVANTGARRFYEREGFREVARTDGDNDEGLPDILLRWAPDRDA
jgi:GNAT superfamily N-acetyltransferase